MSYERDTIRRMRGLHVRRTAGRRDDVIKLNTNENPYPPSPAVDAALKRFDARDAAPLSAADRRSVPRAGRRNGTALSIEQ